MTAGELAQFRENGQNLAWMACHFSSYGQGLSNLPESLPPGSLLMVDDRNPIQGHDPSQVVQQLEDCVSKYQCAGVLLDFQRPGSGEGEAMVNYLESHLSCPLGVSSLYGAGRKSAVCLPPPPCHVPLKAHLAPWPGREIWLELAMEGETISLTKAGAKFAPFAPTQQKAPFWEPAVHCQYAIALEDHQARFTLWRTREDLETLEQEAQTLGVTRTLGLWQELGERNS